MRRLFRFRLRTLLIGTLLFAAWLGWTVSRARQQAETVRLLKAAYGGAFYEFERSKIVPYVRDSSRLAPDWLVRWLGTDFFYDVSTVVFWEPLRGDPDPSPERALALARMARLRGLKDLVIGGVDTPCAKAIGRLKHLEGLYIDTLLPGDLANIRSSLPSTVRIYSD